MYHEKEIKIDLKATAWNYFKNCLESCKTAFPFLEAISTKLPFRVSGVDMGINGFMVICNNPSIQLRRHIPFEVSVWAVFVKPLGDGEEWYIDVVVPMNSTGTCGVFYMDEVMSTEDFRKMLK